MLTQDPLAVVEGRPYGRGVIIGVAAGLGCTLIVLGIRCRCWSRWCCCSAGWSPSHPGT